MKKIITFALALMVSCTLVACGGEPKDAILSQDTSSEEPAKLNQWVETNQGVYRNEDETTYHTCYVRVTKVTTQEEKPEYLKSLVEQHNKVSFYLNEIDLEKEEKELPDDVEFCVLEYDVYYPKDFPTSEDGTIRPNIDFSAGNIDTWEPIRLADGTDFYSGQWFILDTLETEEDPTYFPDKTYSFKTVFAMVKGYKDYVIFRTCQLDEPDENGRNYFHECYSPY